jgi:antitoxin component YwqK of YwqJK toxin-antitoxin module
MVANSIERIDRHKDGSVKAKGTTLNDVILGVVQKRRHKMRSGYLENGKQTGEWTIYDATGKVVKVTRMKSPR